MSIVASEYKEINYMKFKKIFLLMILLLTMVSILQAQETNKPYAAIVGNTLTLFVPGSEPQAVVEAQSPAAFSSLMWHDETLVFMVWDEIGRNRLGYVNLENPMPMTLNTMWLETGYPISFSIDGEHLLFAAPSEQNEGYENYQIDLYRIPLGFDAEPELIGTVPHGVGCGGGSTIPADWVYSTETQGFGGFYLTLQETPFGIVHSRDCGGIVTALFNPETGEDTVISENLAKVVISPDKTKIAGTELDLSIHQSSNVVIYDLETLEATAVPTDYTPDLIAFSADGERLFYTTREATGDYRDELTDQQKSKLDEVSLNIMEIVPTYTTRIIEIELATGENTELYHTDAYAIGQFEAADDSLIFSEIPNLQGWVDATISGELTDANYEDGRLYVQPDLMRLDLSDNSVYLLVEDTEGVSFSQ